MTARAPKLQQAPRVRPLGDLGTDGGRVVEELRRTGETVMLTDGDGPAAVLMTIDEFEQLTEPARFILAINEGLADADAGRTHSSDDAKKMLEKKLGPIPWT